nr:Mu transposase C-terminal domain-containing protein [Microvirga mediterraneensis]
MFSTIHTGLISRFSGRTFANIVQKGDYNSEDNASVPLEELAWALVRYVVDDYHNRPHEGLGGETPRDAWIRISREFGRIGLPDRDTQRAIFGILLTRKLSNGGVRILGLRYQSRELHEWLLRKGSVDLEIRLDPEDIGRISVKCGPYWVTVPCLKPEFDSVSLRTWIAASTELRARFQKAAALVRPVVLEAVRAIETLSRDLQEQAGIANELSTPEEIEQAEARLTIAFSLPDWPDAPDGLASGDILDGIIRTGQAPSAADAPSELPPPYPAAPQSCEGEDGSDETETPDWHMGTRKDE